MVILLRTCWILVVLSLFADATVCHFLTLYVNNFFFGLYLILVLAIDQTNGSLNVKRRLSPSSTRVWTSKRFKPPRSRSTSKKIEKENKTWVVFTLFFPSACFRS